jgi:hypothetical protein
MIVEVCPKIGKVLFLRRKAQSQKLFTTEGTEDTEKNQGLPLMNTDDTDFGEAGGEDGGGKVEFVPVPGGYGFERVRLRIEPELGGQRRPVQPVITPKDPAQVHNSSLRDERLPKGPRFASESLDPDTVVGSVLQTEPTPIWDDMGCSGIPREGSKESR